MTQEVENTVIIGSGPAGYTAAIYACRSGLNPVIVTGSEPGGQLVTTPEIGNWPGRKDAPDGFSLMETLKEHALDLGTRLINDEVSKAVLGNDVKELTLLSGSILKTKTVIIATGAKARYLGLESENKYKGHGVSACATCDGFFFRNKTVAVVGGGSLSKLCESGKVEFVLNATISEIKGDGSQVTAVEVLENNKSRTIPLDGVFVAIGHEAATKIFEGQLELYEDGCIKTGFGSATATSVKGVFAAGDCTDRVYRQAITSAGEGCKAALDVEKYLLG